MTVPPNTASTDQFFTTSNASLDTSQITSQDRDALKNLLIRATMKAFGHCPQCKQKLQACECEE